MCNPTFKVALESGSDFGDTSMSKIWHISDYVFLKKRGLPAPGIYVTDYINDEEWIIKEKDLMDFIKENDIHPKWMKEIEEDLVT